jgi:uncharacterized protein YggT (Ycf19 family)
MIMSSTRPMHPTPMARRLTNVAQGILRPLARLLPDLRKLALRERALWLVMTDRLNTIRLQPVTDRGGRA